VDFDTRIFPAQAAEPARQAGSDERAYCRVGGRRLGRAAVLARLVWFPPTATSNRACGSPAHGSPTFFTAGIRLHPRHARRGRGATMVPLRSISPRRSGDW
jgi:hypothetical protein